jgi:hypothetical protein
MMNLTISIDETTVARARKAAEAQGTSVQALVRAFLRDVAGQNDQQALADRLQANWQSGPGDSGGGYVWRREDGYAGRKVLDDADGTP